MSTSLRLLGGDPGLLELLADSLDSAAGDGTRAEGEILVVLPCLDAAGRPDAEATLEAWRRGNRSAKRILLISSTEAQAPTFAQPGLAKERATKALSGKHPSSDLWCRYERLLVEEAEALGGDVDGSRWRLLRPAPVLAPAGRDPWSRLFSHRWALRPLGFSPPVQFLHVEDLRAAVRYAAEHFEDLPEILNVAPEDAMPFKRALKVAGVRSIALPFFLLFLLRWLGWRLLPAGRSRDPAELDRLRYTSTASGETFRAHGFQPRHGTASAISKEIPASTRQDPFGLDPSVIHKASRTAFRFLGKIWWRVEVEGLRHVPREGPALLLGVHRGLIPFDAMMALDAIASETGRITRFLIHPALLRFPFIGDFMRGLGGVVACRENAEWVLERGEILGLFPEGVRGAFSPYGEAYKVQRFGRAEFVRLALRYRATCALFVTLGSAEVLPVLTTLNWPWWKRWSGWPSFPIPATPLPLPVKWRTEFLSPLELETEETDRKSVKHHSDLVHGLLQEKLLEMRRARRTWFW